MATTDSIQALLKQASERLKNISDSAFFDAELLLAHCLNKNRSYLHTWPEKKLNTIELDQFHALIEKRLTDYPVAYLIGRKPFWTMDIIVTADVLIPRPETELLVEIALDKMKEIHNPKVLDLGTGSGAIALALATERPDAIITAVDYSHNALAVAKTNANELELNEQVSFIQSNWFDEIPETPFDLIVSNPPYIDPADSHLMGTIKYEPLQALVAEKKGMSDIEKIIQKSHPFLKTGGWLILEHGYDQNEQTQQVFSEHKFISIDSIKDLNGNMRVTQAQFRCQLGF